MVAEHKSSQIPGITLETFVRIIKKMPAEKIAEIPVEKLPENIPSNIAERLPLATRGAVESLLLAANSYHLSKRLKDEEHYGESVVQALDRSKLSGDSATVRVFKDKILNMVTMLQDYQRNNQKYEIALFVKNIGHINDLLIDVRSENANLIKTIKLLEEIKPRNDADASRFKDAIAKLNKQAAAVAQLLGEYYVLRLKIMARAIAEKRREVEAQENFVSGLPQEIAVLRKKLEDSQSLWRRTVNRKKAAEETQILQERISALVHDMNESEVVISENDLTIWLDTIVDASLNEYSQKRISRPARDARISLYFLLNKFCTKQEESALQIAQNPFLQVEPEKAINYVLMSEQFILNYFANKKKDATAWLSGAAQAKIEELERLQKDILAELRRSSKIRLK